MPPISSRSLIAGLAIALAAATVPVGAAIARGDANRSHAGADHGVDVPVVVDVDPAADDSDSMVVDH